MRLPWHGPRMRAWGLLVCLALLVFGQGTTATVGNLQDPGEDACEFEAEFAAEPENIHVRCYVPFLNRSKEEYPDLRTLLSYQRPIYDCVDAEDNWYKLGHVDNCWRLEQLDTDISPDVKACLQTWAASPLHFPTSAIRLDDKVRVKKCERSNSSSANGLTSFHLTDHTYIQNSFTSFYVRFAKDVSTGENFYFGVSSRYFAWIKEGTWHFSAHWKNVGTNEYAILKCDDNAGAPVSPCIHFDSDEQSLKEISTSFVYSHPKGDSHASLIEKRNTERPLLGPYFTLLNGLKMPLFGIGTGGMSNTSEALRRAASVGYELIDTAAIYENEDIVGASLKEFHNNPIVQTKVWPTELGFHRTIKSIMHSRVRLGQPILDSVLIHWPKCYADWDLEPMDCGSADPDPDGLLWVDSFRALERLYAEGFVLAIGVSNFNNEYMEAILSESTSVPPLILQNSFSLQNIDHTSVELAREHGILFQGYSVFGQKPVPDEMHEVVLAAMTSEDWKDVTDERAFLIQLMLKSNMGILVRSENPEHIADNLEKAKRSLNLSRDFFDYFDRPEPAGEEDFDVEVDEGETHDEL